MGPTAYLLGTGPEGLDWVCYKVPKTKDQIFAQYNVKIDWETPITPTA